MRRKLLFVSLVSLILGFLVLFIVMPLVLKGGFPLPGIWKIVGEVSKSEQRINLINGLGGTFIRFSASVIIGVLLGIFLGVAQKHSPVFDASLSYWLDIFRITPSIVWISLLYIFLIPADIIPIIISSFFTAFYIALAVEEAITTIPENELIYTYAQRKQSDFNWKVEYCYKPRIFASASSGMRTGGSIALILVIVSEAFVYTPNSLGRLLFSYQLTHAKELLWAVVFILAILALCFSVLFRGLEKLAGGESK